MKKWTKLNVSKEKGGNGLKDLNEMNLALIAKNSWRLFHQPNSIYTKTMKGRYFPLTNPFNASCNDNVSWAWKGIHTGLMLVKEYSIWEIGRGNSVHIFKDNSG